MTHSSLVLAAALASAMAPCATAAQSAAAPLPAGPSAASPAPPAAAEVGSTAATARPHEIPLRTYAHGPLREVSVVIGADTLNFLFDTGGGVTVISPAIAERIGCAPLGRSHGYRMTGESIETPVCADVPLQVAGVDVRGEVSVLDMMKILGPKAPHVDGMISLRTFAGRALTLDLASNRLVLETTASLARRFAAMTEVPMRLATGLAGGELDVFVGVPAGDARLWLLWDSGNQGPTFLGANAAKLLGVEPGPGREHTIRIGSREVLAPVLVKEIIHDGVLNARLVERAVWTLDLGTSRMWVSDVAPLLALPATTAAAKPVPPAQDPEGWYELTLHVNGAPQRTLLHLTRSRALLRFHGEERVFTLGDVVTDRNRVSFTLPLARTYPVRIDFDGVAGTGTWGDATRGGAVEAVKLR